MAEKQLKSSRTLDPYNYVLRVQPRALPDALAPVSGAHQAQIQSNTVLLWLGGDRIFTGSKLSVLNRKEIWKLFYTVS